MSMTPDTLAAAQDQAASLEYNLTDAWTPIDDHPVQASLVYHPAHYKFCPSGRGSGKTMLAKRDGVLDTLQERPWPARIGFTAPTYSRAKDIYYDDLKRLIPKEWIKRERSSLQMMEFELLWGAKIRLFGMSNPKSVEGIVWDKIYFDEIADCPANCIELNIIPALDRRGRKGKAWFIGVPDEVGDNQAEYERYWELGLRWPEDSEVCSFWWSAEDILSTDQIARLENRMDAMAFRQEIRGEFVRSFGKAFPTFSVATHVDADYADYCPQLRVDHTIDFGSRTGASLICQTWKESVWIIDEIVLDGGSTDVVAKSFIERCADRGFSLTRGIGVYGDAAGRTPTSPAGETDYLILRDEYAAFDVEWNQLESNPLVKDTVNVVRGCLMTRSGFVRLYIHPRCATLIQNLKEADWPAKNKLREFHALAALRYYLWKLFGDTTQTGIVGASTATLTAPGEMRQFSSRYR